jgi:hypothetical protein
MLPPVERISHSFYLKESKSRRRHLKKYLEDRVKTEEAVSMERSPTHGGPVISLNQHF